MTETQAVTKENWSNPKWWRLGAKQTRQYIRANKVQITRYSDGYVEALDLEKDMEGWGKSVTEAVADLRRAIATNCMSIPDRLREAYQRHLKDPTYDYTTVFREEVKRTSRLPKSLYARKKSRGLPVWVVAAGSFFLGVLLAIAAFCLVR